MSTRLQRRRGRDLSPNNGWAHAAVLVVLSCLLSGEGPHLRFFSALIGATHPMAIDPLGGLVRVVCVVGLVAYATTIGRTPAWAGRIRAFVVALFFLAFAILPTISDMGARSMFGLRFDDGTQVSNAHDGGVLQTEAALDALVSMRSPYSEDFRTTVMAEGADSDPAVWTRYGYEENPAFDFFPYPPGVLLVSLPAYGVSHALFGGYDQRVTYLLALLLLVALLARTATRAARSAVDDAYSDGVRAHDGRADDEYDRDPVEPALIGSACIALVALNPFLAVYVPAGRNDILFITGLVITVALWRGSRWRWAGVALAVACSLKQFAWPLVPLFLAHAYKRNRLRPALVSFVAISAAIWLPFLLWDAQDMLHDLLIGQGSIYPFRTRGYGVTDLWVFLGLIQTPMDPFDNTPLLVAVAGGTAALGVIRVLQRGDMGTALRYYGLTLFATLFFGRYFAANHFGALLSVLLLTVLVHQGAFRPPRAPFPHLDPDDDD